MTTDELKQKIIDKAAEMLENAKSCKELSQLAAAYNQITANDTMQSIGEMISKKPEPVTTQTPNMPPDYLLKQNGSD